MSKLSEKIEEEIFKMIPPTIFFLITLSLVTVMRVLMLKGTGIPVNTPIQAAVGALVLGKAVLIADMLPVINRYPDKPLTYNVVWKTLIYVLAALVIHYLERLVDFWREAGGFVAGNERLLAEMVWPHFWAIQLILFVLIFNYCVLHEITRVIGPKTFREIFFGRPADAARYAGSHLRASAICLHAGRRSAAAIRLAAVSTVRRRAGTTRNWSELTQRAWLVPAAQGRGTPPVRYTGRRRRASSTTRKTSASSAQGCSVGTIVGGGGGMM